MKSLLIVLFVAVSSFTTFGQDTGTMNATYEGYSNGVYSFTDDEGEIVEFNNVTNEVSSKYDLTSQKFVGRQFSITFTVDSELDEDDEEIQVSTIVDLLMPE
ncbi:MULTISPECIES: hypothetical protein [Maribacter]|uniref:hypothetical protein n=1 Tax=Maribacter TaxID=252356 RepID=UPI0004794F87|nr:MULTISPECIES: hypothetical protein [Maribacter]|tara:strand:- start:464 stop:769 length:306 start_codon:yes stop_codon:yes gene_type:complete